MAEHFNQEQLLSSLKSLVAEACRAGNVESVVDGQSVTVKLRFGKSPSGDFDFARKVAAILAQETM